MATFRHYTNGEINKPEGGIEKTRIRESSVLRNENGQWKMIAHHADGLEFWARVVGQQ